MNIGIIVAEKEEMLAIKKLLKNISEEKIYNLTFIKGEIENKKVILVECGVGKVNSARTTQILIDKFEVDYVFNMGVAGGINQELNIGDIVIGEKLVQYDFDVSSCGDRKKAEIPDVGVYINSNKKLIELCEEVSKEIDGINIKTGIIASADKFLNDPKEAFEIKSEFNAECAEMEGSAIAQVCYLDNIPFLVIRGISDVVNGNNQIDFHTFIKKVSIQVASLLEKLIKNL